VNRRRAWSVWSRELTGVTHQQGAEIAKQLCLIRAELAGIRMAIVDAATAGRSSEGDPERKGPAQRLKARAD
jgi:hypothetical protein